MTATTWDGLSIAEAAPRGSAIVTRRAGESGYEYLLLHRAATGSNSNGPWSWTPPSGMRRPGEAVYPAAVRELTEETGLNDVDIRPVDLGRNHALWMTGDIRDRAPVLDAEHDQMTWASVEDSTTLCQPSTVATGVTTVDGVPDVTMDFRPLTGDDFTMLSQWSHRRHLTPAWFHRALTPAAATDRYRSCLDSQHPVDVHIVTINGLDAGIAQFASVADLPDHLSAIGHAGLVAIGFAIADGRWIGRGLGPQLIWAIIRRLVMARHPAADGVVAFTARGNHASARALHKSGFTTDGVIELGGRRRVTHHFNPGHWLGPA